MSKRNYKLFIIFIYILKIDRCNFDACLDTVIYFDSKFNMDIISMNIYISLLLS